MVPEIWRVFVILDNFLPFYIPNNPENQNFEKMKKAIGDVIILDMRTKNHNHMMYGSWDMKHDRQIFFVILGHFLPFYLNKNPKIKILKKWKKKYLEISLFYTSVNKNHHQMLYCSWDMARDGCNFYFPFWAIFCPPNNSPKNQNLKNEKNALRYRGGCPT